MRKLILQILVAVVFGVLQFEGYAQVPADSQFNKLLQTAKERGTVRVIVGLEEDTSNSAKAPVPQEVETDNQKKIKTRDGRISFLGSWTHMSGQEAYQH